MTADHLLKHHHLISTMVVAVLLYVSYCMHGRLYAAYRIRSHYHDLPSLSRHPLWGNLVNAGKRLGPSLNRHPDYGFEEIWRELKQPGCFLVDLAPIQQRGILVIAEPHHVEQLLNLSEKFKYSLPKDSSSYKPNKPLLGAESIVTKEGSDWKATRKRFNPGFQPKHIHSLTEQIVTWVRIFVSRLQQLANNEEPFRLADFAQEITFDITTQITMAKDLHAQSEPENRTQRSKWGLSMVNRRLSKLTAGSGRLLGLHVLNIIRPIK